MPEIYFAFMGTAAALAVFAGGIALGLKYQSYHPRGQPEKRQPDSLSEAEKRRIREEREAFQILQNYSANDAYGVNPEKRNGDDCVA